MAERILYDTSKNSCLLIVSKYNRISSFLTCKIQTKKGDFYIPLQKAHVTKQFLLTADERRLNTVLNAIGCKVNSDDPMLALKRERFMFALGKQITDLQKKGELPSKDEELNDLNQEKCKK